MTSSDSDSTVFRCPELSIVDLDGVDAEAILNNLTTNRVRDMATGDAVETFLTNVKGKCIGHVMAYRTDSGYRLIGAGGQSQAVVDLLDRYTIREDAVPTIRDEAILGWAVMVSRGPALDGDQPGEERGWCRASTATGRFDLYRVPWLGFDASGAGETWLCAAGGDGPDASVVDERSLEERAREAIERWWGASVASEPWGDVPGFHAARVAAGFPWYGIDFGDSHLPQEVNRNESTLCFTKGCYLGQETVARLDALGQVQKQIVGWRIEGLPADQQPPADTKLYPLPELPSPEEGHGVIPDAGVALEGKPVGRLTSVAPLPASSTAVALGFARRSHFDPDAVAVGELASGVRFRATVRSVTAGQGDRSSRLGGRITPSHPGE